MKIYDKEIYDRQKNINTLTIILLAFIIGFACGYIANAKTDKPESAENSISIQNETSYTSNTTNTTTENSSNETK